MASKIVTLRPDGVVPGVVAEPDAELIDRLEIALADAKSGQLRAAGFVFIDRDRAICTGWSGHADHHDMTAGVSLLAFRYMRAGVDEDG